jgi:hypothetical protein
MNFPSGIYRAKVCIKLKSRLPSDPNRKNPTGRSFSIGIAQYVLYFNTARCKTKMKLVFLEGRQAAPRRFELEKV